MTFHANEYLKEKKIDSLVNLDGIVNFQSLASPQYSSSQKITDSISYESHLRNPRISPFSISNLKTKEAEDYTSVFQEKIAEPKKRNQNRLNALLKKAKETKQEEKIKERKVTKKPFDESKISLSGELEFSKTYLESICSNEPIVIYSSNKFYSLEEENSKKSGYFINYLGKSFELIESAEVLGIEKEFLRKNQDNIKKFQIKNIEKIANEFSDLSENLLRIKDSIENKFSMEEFIVDYVFAIYNKRPVGNTPKEIKIKINPEEIKTSLEPSEIILENKDSILESTIKSLLNGKTKKSGGLAIMLGGVYSLEPLENAPNGSKRKELDLEKAVYLTSIEEFNNEYKREISNQIKSKVKKNIFSEIERLDETKYEIENIKRIKRNLPTREGDISFTKEDNEYKISLEIPEFVMSRGREYWHFDSVKLSTKLRQTERQLFLEKDIYPNPSYYIHPFIFEDGTMCMDGDRQEECGIKKYRHDIKGLDKKVLAKNIVDLLKIARQILRTGNRGDPIPANRSAFEKREISQRRASELKSRGVKIYIN